MSDQSRRDVVASSTKSTPAASGQDVLDPYRSLPAAMKRPLAPHLPIPTSTPTPSIPTLLSLSASTYTHRLQGKTVFLDQAPSGPSPLVQGKKLHRGDPAAFAKAREAARGKEKDTGDKGLMGLRKVKRVHAVPKGGKVDYNAVLPLHHLHILYLASLLSLPPLPPRAPHTPLAPLPSLPPSPAPSLPPGNSPEGITSKLSKADFTGIHLSISSSRNPSLINLSGLVIEETASTFRLISPDNRVRVIPKDGTCFTLRIPAYAPPTPSPPPAPMTGDGDGEPPDPVDMRYLDRCPRMEISLLGSSFAYRSADRAGRKFRPQQGNGGGSGWGQEWVQGDWSEVFRRLERSDDAGRGGAEERRLGRGERGEKGSGQKRKQDEELGMGAAGRRKRGKSRRQDPPAGGSLEVHY